MLYSALKTQWILSLSLRLYCGDRPLIVTSGEAFDDTMQVKWLG